MTYHDYLRTAGPPMPVEEIRLHLRPGLEHLPAVRAILDLLDAKLTACHEAAAAHPAQLTAAEERNYHGGAANALEDLANEILGHTNPR